MLNSRFELVHSCEHCVILRDLNGHISLTNDAEEVSKIFNAGRIFYYDTGQNKWEIVHKDGKFLSYREGWHV